MNELRLNSTPGGGRFYECSLALSLEMLKEIQEQKSEITEILETSETFKYRGLIILSKSYIKLLPEDPATGILCPEILETRSSRP